MGRNKTYNRDEVAKQALQVFWEKGFERTSLKDLEAATGVNRYGLYDSFVDKQGLFLECVERYCSTQESALQELASAGIEGLLHLLGRFEEPAENETICQHGCMTVSALLERDGLSPEIRQRLGEHVTFTRDQIRNVLVSEQEAGTVRADLDVAESVGLVHLFLIGLPTIGRMSSDNSNMRLGAKAAAGIVRSWKADAGQ
jgi:AcrR family transcriptional regulator